MTLAELKEIAKDLGIKNISKLKKSELEQLAKEDNRSLTSYIVNVLKKHVDQSKALD